MYFRHLLNFSLREKNTTETIRQNRREIPLLAKEIIALHESQILQPENSNITLTKYQCKQNKSVLLSSLHSDIEIPSRNNPKQKPETVLCYNKKKLVLTYWIKCCEIILQSAHLEDDQCMFSAILLTCATQSCTRNQLVQR